MTSVANIKAKLLLDVGIVGAGIGGLAAAIACARVGLKVAVYEASPEITETGAGLQIGPNMTRILRRWKLLDAVQLGAIPLEAISLRRYDDDTEISQVPMTDLEKEYNAPMCVVHRADLQQTLKIGAEALGVQILTGSPIEDIDFENACIKIKNREEWIQKDLIIAADGIKSNIRRKMLALHGDIDKLQDSSEAAWRVLISSEQIHESGDIYLINTLKSPIGIRWLASVGNIVCYPVRNHELLNMVLIHPAKQSSDKSLKRKRDKQEVLNFFQNWNPRVQKLLNYVEEEEILEWRLCDHPPLATWIEGKVALMGDAAHPMLPFGAHGSGQAVEDGAVLAICIAMISNKSQIHTALKVYELVRKERAETLQAKARQIGQALSLHKVKSKLEHEDPNETAPKTLPYPEPYCSKLFQIWYWDTDVENQVINMWDDLVQLITSGKEFVSPFSTESLGLLDNTSKVL